MGKVRLVDIANAVGASTVTVHNALTGQKGVSESLREQIQKAAEELGYENHRKARPQAEQTEDFQKIGVLIAERYLGNHTTYYWKLYQELALAATEKQCYTTIETLKNGDGGQHLELPQMVLQNKVEGLIIVGEIDKQYIRRLWEAVTMPVVFLDFYDHNLANDAVIADNFYGMYQMTEVLLERGMKEIGFIGSIYSTSSIMDRYCGFMKAMTQHRLNVHLEWLIEDRNAQGIVEFELPRRLPEAFVCNCDLVAGMLVYKLNERGLKVPDDVSVVGFDNFLYPGYADMKITTYEVNTKAMVRVAIKKLMKQFKNPNSGRGLEIISGHVVMKNSVRRNVL